MSNPLCVGVMGCGDISRAYFRLIPMFRGVEIHACADRDLDAARKAAKDHGVRALTPEELLDAEDLDLVLNLTPPNAHVAISKAALRAGKHVYSEKPFALSMNDARALDDLARDKGLRVGAAPDTFLGGAHQHARALIDDGAIGAVTTGACYVMSRGMEDWHPNPAFFFQKGGGPILDIGPYYIANLVQLLGPAKAVAAMSATGFAERVVGSGPRKGAAVAVETPTTLHALILFESGAVITLGASWDVSAHGHAPIELYGTEKSLYLADPNFFGGALTLASGDEEETLESDHPFARPNDDVKGEILANYRACGLADMARAIAEKKPHRASSDFLLHVTEILLAIEASAAQRAFVSLETRCARPAALGAEEAASLLR